MTTITIIRADGRELVEAWQIERLVSDLIERAVAALVGEMRAVVGQTVAKTINTLRGRAD